MYFEHANLELSDQTLDKIAKRKGISREQAIELIRNDPDPIATSRRNRARRLMEEGRNRDQGEMEGIRNTKTGVGSLPMGVVKGIVGAGDAALSLPIGIANLIAPKSMQLREPRNSEGTAYDIGRTAGDLASFLGVGGPAKAGLKLAEAAPSAVGKTAEWLGKGNFLPSAVRRSLGAAAYEGAKTPGEEASRSGNAAVAGTVSALLESAFGIPKTAMAIGRGARDYFAKSTPSEVLRRNLRLSRGTETPIGDVMRSPTLKKEYENYLSVAPFSGVNESLSRTGNKLEEEAAGILREYRQKTAPKDIPHVLGKSLQKNYSAKNAIKRGKYNSVEEQASREGYKPELRWFEKELEKESESILPSKIPADIRKGFDKMGPEARRSAQSRAEASHSLAATNALLKNIPNKTPKEKLAQAATKKVSNREMKVALEKIEKPQDIYEFLKKYSSEGEGLSYAQVRILKSALYQAKKSLSGVPGVASESSKRSMSRLGRILSTNLKQDVEKRGSTELNNLIKDADSYYKKEIAPYKSKKIFPVVEGEEEFTRGLKTGANPEQITSRFVKSGRTDESSNLRKIFEIMTPKEKALFKAEYLRNAAKEDGGVDPGRLRTLLSSTKLGGRQKEVLFGGRKTPERRKIEDFVARVNLNPEALIRMLNPKTGNRLLQHTNDLKSIDEPGKLGHLATSAMWALGYTGVARVLANLFTNEKIREKWVKSIIKGRVKSKMRAKNAALGKTTKSAVVEDLLKKYLINKTVE